MSSNMMVHKTLRLPQDLVDATKLAAREAGLSMADYIRFALRQSIERQEVASGMARVEERMASQMLKLQRKVDQVQRAQQLQFAVLDEYMKVALALEPDIPDERGKASARAIGFRRHRSIFERVPQVVSGSLNRLFGEGSGDGG